MAIVIQYLQFYNLHLDHRDVVSFNSSEKVLFVGCVNLVLLVTTFYTIQTQNELMNNTIFPFFQMLLMISICVGRQGDGDPELWEINFLVIFARCSLVTNLTFGIMIFSYISNI